MSDVNTAAAAAPAPAAPVTAPAAPAVPPVPVLPHGVRLYEAMWVVDANTGREDFNKCIAGIKEIVEKGGGSWINADKWEERKLAYPIKKKKRALYIINHFSAPTESIVKIERNARLYDLTDSLGLTEIVMDLEDEFEGSMSDEAVGTIQTVGQLIDYVRTNFHAPREKDKAGQ